MTAPSTKTALMRRLNPVLRNPRSSKVNCQVLIAASGTPAALPEVTLAERGYKGTVYQTHGVANSDFLRVGARPIHKQYVVPEMSPFMGTKHTGKFPGKMIWVHHTHDASLWPSQGVGMQNNVAIDFARRFA